MADFARALEAKANSATSASAIVERWITEFIKHIDQSSNWGDNGCSLYFYRSSPFTMSAYATFDCELCILTFGVLYCPEGNYIFDKLATNLAAKGFTTPTYADDGVHMQFSVTCRTI